MLLSELDRLDRKILLELDQDANLSLSQISRKIRLGNDLVEYRMKRFFREGVINKITPVINPKVLGFNVYKTYIKHRIPDKTKKSWIQKIDKHENTYWLVEGYGKWDILISIAAKSLDDYQKILDVHIGNLGEHIIEVAVFPLIRIQRFDRKYLLPDLKYRKITSWEENLEKVHLDRLEEEMLWELSDNTRITDTELASRLKVSNTMVNYRRNNFLKKKVIVGNRVQLNYEILGMFFVKFFIELKEYSASSRKVIQQFCEKEPEITCYCEQIGTFNIEFEAELSGFQNLNYLLDRFRDKFSSLVARTEYMVLTKDYYHRVPRISYES